MIFASGTDTSATSIAGTSTFEARTSGIQAQDVGQQTSFASNVSAARSVENDSRTL